MYEIYTVKDGDTLEGIANMYGTTVGILRQINGFFVDDDVISDTQIVVPVKSKQPYLYYTVKKGDTLMDIALKNNIDYNLLLQLNGLDDGDYIYPNQTIMVPRDDVGIYMTINNDTLAHVLRKLNITIDELMNENENIFLREDQILIFKRNNF